MSSETDRIAATLGETVEGYQAAVDDFDREVARLLGVNETDVRCLEILIQETSDTATPRLLADRLGLTTGSVTAMLDRLEKIGYITRAPHPTDRRKLLVRATATAADRARELIMPLVQDSERQLLPDYTEQQLRLVTEFLGRLTDLQQSHVQRLRALRPFPRPQRDS
ncbi:DNA-binding MarR family transcriptional regulator [Nocardia sp. GAS34]|uniref:MarR family winged helix-turn-helix transcriptional regulator n=1 Tax=unclassified Nocardia TaxID=2637762 RepID=UPI003D1ECC8A